MNMADDYQAWQNLTAWYRHSGTRDTLEMTYLALGVSGEAGEAADAVKKSLRVYGEGASQAMNFDDNIKLAQEIGDVLWYVTRFCTFFKISLNALMLMNMLKLFDRLNERKESGLGPIEWPNPDGITLAQARTIVNGAILQITGPR